MVHCYVNGEFVNITGTNPQAGVDIEPNSSYDKVEHVVIDAVRTANCTGPGIKIDPNALSDAIGTHDGSGNAATLSDSSQSWTTNEFVGRTVVNLTDGSSGVITANTATTITATLAGGTDNDWDVGDEYNFASSFTLDVRSCEDFSSASGVIPGSLNVGNSIIDGKITITDFVSREAENSSYIVRNWDVNAPLIEFIRPKSLRPNQAGSSSTSLGAAFLFYAPSGDTGATTLGNISVYSPVIRDDQGNVTNYFFVRDQRASPTTMSNVNIYGKIDASGQSTATSSD